MRQLNGFAMCQVDCIPSEAPRDLANFQKPPCSFVQFDCVPNLEIEFELRSKNEKSKDIRRIDVTDRIFQALVINKS